MNWFLLSLLPPALWSATNHIDKYLISSYFRGGGVGALMIFSSIIGVFLLPVIALLHPSVLSVSWSSVLIALNGCVYLAAVLPYFHALEKDEASVCVPLFQLVPVFSYFLAYLLLGETLTITQIVGGILIVLGAITISLEIGSKKLRFKREVFWLMMLSSFIYALNFLLFKYFSIQSDFWYTSFWEYVGFGGFALCLLLFVKSYRRQWLRVMQTNKLTVLGINGANELINILAKITFNAASLLTPITLTWVVNGFQPVFVFLYGIILTLFFPHIIKEDVSSRRIIQKLGAILVMGVGALILQG